jgi:hypothetical protein
MRTRHRIPILVTLSMMDVLCCALGCVILLWLLGARQTKMKAEEAIRSATELSKTQHSLSDTAALADWTALERDVKAMEAQGLAAERDKLDRQLADARGRIERQAADKAELERQAAATEAELSRKLREQRAAATAAEAELAKKLREQQERVAATEAELKRSREDAERLATLVRDREKARDELARRAGELSAQLDRSDARYREAKATADALPTAEAEARDLRGKLGAAEARVQKLERDAADQQRDLADARRSVVDLQGDKRSLADQIDKVRAAADNRFAGIQLTGRKVVFIVDMSGSMEQVDERTVDPNKWPGVRETVAKVMKSLPDLKEYQVIVFSTEARYLFGDGSEWLPFNPATTPGEVERALAAIKPRGNTDMHAAFEAAFRFRRAGLDTIYLFSDGLPNVGAGITPTQLERMTETEKGELLGRFIRNKLKMTWNRPQNGQRVRINSVGFFYESPDVGAFLWALSRENDGSFVGMSKP